MGYAIVTIASLEVYKIGSSFGIASNIAECALICHIPITDFGLLDIFDIPEEDAAHVDVLRLVVVVEVVGTVSFGLPLAVALLRARCLIYVGNTRPHAAQMAWSGSWPKGLPHVHLSYARGTSIKYPRLKSLKVPSPSCELTLTACITVYA